MESNDREMLVRIDARTEELHRTVIGHMGRAGLVDRVDDLESAKDQARGWIGGIVAVWTAVGALAEYLFHKGH